MIIEIDSCPTSKRKHYFISVTLNEKESLSFDHTIKGHRVIKQALIKKGSHKKTVEKYGGITGEWDTIVLEDGKFVKKYHVKWIDRDKLDIINGEAWETVWVKSVSDGVDEKLLYYSRFVSDNYKNLGRFSKEMEEFEDFLSELVAKYR